MALKFLDLRVFQQAAVLAYNHVFGIATAIFVVAFPLVFLLKNPSFVGRKNGPVPPPSVE
jgi:hypothetical protein